MLPPITGRCFCGRTRYRATTPPLWQAFCHCESCRRATASPFTAFFGIRDGDWRWQGLPPSTFSSSSGVWRDFCPTCGTQMTYRSTRFPNETHFYAATLDHPETYAPTAHVHVSERLPWIHLNDGLAQHQTTSSD